MARASSVRSGENSAEEVSKSPKTKLKENVDAMDVDENAAESEEEPEEEYEIEQIIDARRGSFPDGRMGYLVKWKGYGEEENSWVDEKDAGNAEELIAEYWRKLQKKQKQPRKSTESKTAKRPRKSVAEDESAGESASAVKKRGRKPQPESDEEEAQPAKPKSAAKPKKSAGKKAATSEDEIEEVVVGDMSSYMDQANWDSLVEAIDTIERVDKNKLVVYFVLRNGERIREDFDLCRDKFPQKLIDFFTSHLHWRTATSEGEEP